MEGCYTSLQTGWTNENKGLGSSIKLCNSLVADFDTSWILVLDILVTLDIIRIHFSFLANDSLIRFIVFLYYCFCSDFNSSE